MAIAKLPPSILASTGDSEQIPKHGYGHINHAYDGEGDRASARTQFVDSSPSRANDATSQHPVSHKESTDSIIVEHNKYVNESVVSKTDDLRRNNEQQSEASSLSSLNNKIWKDVDDAMPQDRQVSNSIIGSGETVVKSSEDGIQVFNEDILENAVSLLPQEELLFQPVHSQIKPNHDPEDSYSSSAQPTQYAFNRDNDFMSTQAIDDHSTTNIRPGDQPQYIDKNLSKETNAEGLKRAISGLNLDKLFDDYARKSSTLQFPSAQDNVNDNKT